MKYFAIIFNGTKLSPSGCCFRFN